MTYKNKCLKALNSEDFFIKSRDNQFYAKIYKDYGDILLDNFSTAYVYTSKDNKSEPKTRILSIITYDKKSYKKDCKANEISSIDGNKIFSPVKNKPYSVEIAGVLSIDHDACERIARKSHNLYRKIRLEFEREFTNRTMIREMKNESKQNSNI